MNFVNESCHDPRRSFMLSIRGISSSNHVSLRLFVGNSGATLDAFVWSPGTIRVSVVDRKPRDRVERSKAQVEIEFNFIVCIHRSTQRP